jgi:hypothetical protein
VSSHAIFPDTKIFREFVLSEETDLLKGKVPFFISDPGFPGKELSFLVVVEGDTLAADGHVLVLVAAGVGDYLVVVGVLDAVEVEEVLEHFREVVVKLEDVVRPEIGSDAVLALF